MIYLYTKFGDGSYMPIVFIIRITYNFEIFEALNASTVDRYISKQNIFLRSWIDSDNCIKQLETKYINTTFHKSCFILYNPLNYDKFTTYLNNLKR